MKFSQLLNNNIVPEWRDQYLDYRELNASLERALDAKAKTNNEPTAENMYQSLIKYDQQFAENFLEKCRRELEKVNSFHQEKLTETKGKYQTLKDQLDAVLASPLYREIQRQISKDTSLRQLETLSSETLGRVKRSLKRAVSDSKTKSGAKNPVCFHQAKSHSIFSVDRILHAKSQQLSASECNSALDSFNFASMNYNDSRSVGDFSNDVNFDPSASHRKSGDEAHSVGGHNFYVLDRPQLRGLSGLQQPRQKCSKSFLVKSYRKKLSQLKSSYEDLYYSLVLFEQYTQLNYAGFEQVLRRYDRMFASSCGRKFFTEKVQASSFYHNLQQIDFLIEGVEHLYTLHFVNGNRRLAIERLHISSNVYNSQMLDFRIGVELGVFLVLFSLVLVAGFSSETSYEWTTVFRLFRSPMLLIIFLFQTGISLVIWRHFKINHVLIFELNPRDNLTYHHFFEFGSLLGIIWSIGVLVFIFSERLDVRPSMCPLIVVLLIGCYIFNPTSTGHFKARVWLLRKLARIFTAPLHKVRFADFWIADQLVSIVPLFLDLEFLSCFYTTDDVFSVAHLGKVHSSKYRFATGASQSYINRPITLTSVHCIIYFDLSNWKDAA